MKSTLNTSRRWFIGGIALAMGMLSIATTASGDELADLKERFKERASTLLSLRNAGTVGETFDGMVALVKGQAGDDAAAIVSAENADRAKLYALIASKQGVKAEIVGERNAIRNFKNAEPDHYLKTRDGSWVQKKNVKIEE
jgi:uncharacterized protein YdbL (DUF1318 family)